MNEIARHIFDHALRESSVSAAFSGHVCVSGVYFASARTCTI